MAVTEAHILDALRHVDDPDLKKDLVTLNMVKDIQIEGSNVSFTVVLTTPACPMKEMIQNACVTAVKHLVDPNLEVNIHMTAQVTEAPGREGLPNVKNIVAVASGKGGVGKSTIAANLAIGLAQAGSRVGMLDADIYGPSQPIMFDLRDQQPPLRSVNGRDMMVPLEQYGVQVNSLGFLVPPEQAVVWRGPMASKALMQLVHDTAWDNLDYLIVDLPPGTGDIHISIAQQLPLNGAVIVSTPQQVAVADAHKATAMFISEAISVPVLGLVENMAWFVPEDMPDRKYYIFGQGGVEQLADDFALPILAHIPLVEAIRETSDAGRPAALDPNSIQGAAFRDMAAAVAQQVSIINANRMSLAGA